jgi:citrate lyase subunit beta/citryl-CoA lyase
MLPKAETASRIAAVMGALPADGRVLPLIETARGVENVDAVAAAPGVERLAFGTLDYGVDLDLSGDDRGLIYPSARIALASRCAGLASPVAGVTPAIDDDERLLADLAFARAFGFGAKLCIHPKQVGAIRKALLPTAAEVDWARRVLAAAEGAQGAVQVDGRMVDRPVLLKAHAILDRLPP